MRKTCTFFVALVMMLSGAYYPLAGSPRSGSPYEQLNALFREWRSFEKPPLRDGAPDYSAATFAVRRPAFQKLYDRLLAIDTTGWSAAQRADWQIVRAEMNGYDFNQRVLMPWARDPAFYKSIWTDRSYVPAHEGHTHHATT